MAPEGPPLPPAACMGAARPRLVRGALRLTAAGVATATSDAGDAGAPARVKWGRLPWGLPPAGGSLENIANI